MTLNFVVGETFKGNQMKIPMPEKLEPLLVYNKNTDAYCLVGWLAKHLCNVDAKDAKEDHVFDALRNLLGVSSLLPIWQPIAHATTNEERLEECRRICNKYRIKIYEATN